MAKGRNDTLDLGEWFILRMASVETLTVWKELKKRGFTVWTPIERKVGRMPRTRKEYDKTFAIMPSYVFAHVDDMDDIRRLAVIPTSNCPRFTVFQHQGGIPLIADVQLDGLRYQEDVLRSRFEKYKASKQKPPVFDPGLEIAFSEGGFMGLKGKVIESKGRFTLVDIPGFAKPIQISSLLLAKDVLAADGVNRGAKAA